MRVQQRKFVVKAGMTPQDVINSNSATVAQKKMATCFDSDGIPGYSTEEAERFNSTCISLKSNNEVSLFTRDKNGKLIHQENYKGDLFSYKYMPKESKTQEFRYTGNIAHFGCADLDIPILNDSVVTTNTGVYHKMNLADGAKGIIVRDNGYEYHEIVLKNGTKVYSKTTDNWKTTEYQFTDGSKAKNYFKQ